jgi:hypothetical protein
MNSSQLTFDIYSERNRDSSGGLDSSHFSSFALTDKPGVKELRIEGY